MTDYYIEILKLIKENKGASDEELAHIISDEIRDIVMYEFRTVIDKMKR